MGTLFFEFALTCYFAATIIGIIDLFRGQKEPSPIVVWITAAGFMLHLAAIIIRYAVAGQIPITSMHESASFFAWCTALIYLVLHFRYRIGILGSFIIPLIFLIMLASAMLPRVIKPLTPALQSSWLLFHTTFAFLGFAAFTVAFGVGVMYLIQEHHLKAKRLTGLFQRLPDIQVLDEISYRLITFGFPLLTLAIITGALWAQDAWGTYWRWDPKETWSLITWIIYAMVLHIRLVVGWRGRRAALLCIVGFLAVLFTFFGVNFLLKSVHSF
ncbi:MAG: c-type cytochrome biogenesis protein CcsB [Nitrospiraceae bacterium]|jgi:cytochrome c-type biogenesis protein CcsB|nr:c-type cytochrome biogenesis protein CcsB [Nitrospiraceae bacterium]